MTRHMPSLLLLTFLIPEREHPPKAANRHHPLWIERKHVEISHNIPNSIRRTHRKQFGHKVPVMPGCDNFVDERLHIQPWERERSLGIYRSFSQSLNNSECASQCTVYIYAIHTLYIYIYRQLRLLVNHEKWREVANPSHRFAATRHSLLETYQSPLLRANKLINECAAFRKLWVQLPHSLSLSLSLSLALSLSLSLLSLAQLSLSLHYSSLSSPQNMSQAIAGYILEICRKPEVSLVPLHHWISRFDLSAQ